MGSVLASTIFTEVSGVLYDTSAVHWTDAEKLRFLNAGQRQLVLFKPDAYAINDEYKLAAGTIQSIPDGSAAFTNAAAATLVEGIQFIKLTRNMGIAGLVAGDAIPVVDMTMMDSAYPGWHAETATAAVQNYMFDERDPKHFYVYPANTGTGYVEAVYSGLPAAVATTATAITLSDVYQHALTDYVLFRCYGKDAALSPYNAERAVFYWNQFVEGIGRMDMAKKMESPNLKQPNPSPSRE